MSATADPYDWPMPNRRDCMSLQTLKRSEVSERVMVRDTNMRVNDIQGAQPCIKAYRFTQKEDYTNKKDDIEGASSKQLIKSSNRMDNQLHNKDIYGTQPQINKFVTTREPSNPLEPLYNIPKTEPLEPVFLRFIRDNINIDDIEGSRPMPHKNRLRKNVIVFEEIEGSKPKTKFQPRDHIEIMDVRDINNYREFKSGRVTNPLDPVYVLKDETGQLVNHGRVNGSQSRQLHPKTVTKFTSSNLHTLDIGGAQSGTHAEMFLKSQTRKDFRVTNETKEIPGAQTGSLRRGIESQRRINPLAPTYQIPGNTEIYGYIQQVLCIILNSKKYRYDSNTVFSKSLGLKNASQNISQQKLINDFNRARLSNAQKLDSFLSK